MRVRCALVLFALVGSLGGAHSAGAAALVSLGPAAATWGGTGATFAPISVASPPNDPRLFVVQRGGAVRIVEDGIVRPTPFLTVPGVDTAGERGLLSIAFPWDYSTSGRFYVFASIAGTPAQTRILEYRVGADPNVADAASARTVLTQDLTAATNHNGGQLAFGPDWRLYVAVGDNAMRETAQAPASLLGKVLRIDPTDPDGDGPATYSVPDDNPFPGSPVWALGLRNPFRAAFDPAGRLIIADVGEGTWEEINVGAAGANYGWPRCEGTCSVTGMTNPFHAYAHADPAPLGGCSIIGGVVVRDARVAGLSGRYLFGDYCRQPLRTADLAATGPDVQLPGLSLASGFTLIGFGEDARGCAYVLADRTVYRLANEPTDGVACTAPFLPAPPNPRTPPNVGTPTPPAAPSPVVPGLPATAPVVPAPVNAIPKNCVRGGAMSIRPSRGRITAVRAYRGRTTRSVRFKRNGARVELRGLPSSLKVKLRVSVRLKSGKTVRVIKTYRACT